MFADLLSWRRNGRRRRRRHHWLEPIERGHEKHLMAVCMFHCFRLVERSPSSLPSHSSSSSSKMSRLARQRHQLRRADFELVVRREVDMKEIAREEKSIRSRRNTNASDVLDGLAALAQGGPGGGGDDSVVVFKIYAPAVFRAMRAAMDIDQDDYVASLAPEAESWPYLSYVSGSKSKSSFMFTCDRRFVLKVEKGSSIARLRSILEDYIGHFIASPHSLIVKILGAYSFKIGHRKPVYILVTQSVFWPSSRIAAKFDLKGCLAGRTEQLPNRCGGKDQSDTKPGEEEFVVLKDGNFIGADVNLGGSNRWFAEQLTRDVTFLRAVGAVDYSLLVGIQPLNNSDIINSRSGGDEEEDGRSNYEKFASAIKRSSLGFLGVGPSSPPPPQSARSSRTLLGAAMSSLEVSGISDHAVRRPSLGAVELNISSLADYMDAGDDGTILVDVNETGRLEERFAAPDEDDLSELASEILAEPDGGGGERERGGGGGQHHQYQRRYQAAPKQYQQPKKLKVKQVKFDRSVGVMDFDDDDDWLLEGGGATPHPPPAPPPPSQRSPSPGLQFQLHPPPKDLPETPPAAVADAPRFSGVSGNPAGSSSSSSSLRLAQPGKLASRLNLRTLLPGGNGGVRVEPLASPANPPPPPPLPPPSPFALTPLILEAEEEIQERQLTIRQRRGDNYRVQQQHRQQSGRRGYRAPASRAPPRRSTSHLDPDRIERAPGNFPDSPFSASLFNWRQFPADLLGGPDNRRLLPDSPNGVHVLDGHSHRYYLGIVDILGSHNLKRRLSSWLKTATLCDDDHSGVDPQRYAARFHEFMMDNI